MRSPRPSLATLLLAASVLAPGALAQEEPLAAGSDGVPVPKKTKHVQPAYPAEAMAQGIRGIVILEVLVSAEGKVEEARIVRSVPGLDEAAIAAARQWEYEPTRVDGRPARVRVTVPITFSLKLPQLDRQAGVPELRQGVTPAWPREAGGGGLATAEVTLEPDGRIGAANVVEGGAPWTDALLAALRTWRFAPPPEDEVVSFRVEAEFVAGRGDDGKQVNLRATGLRRSDLMADATPAAPETPSEASPPAEPAAPTSAAPEPAPEPAPATPAPATPSPVPPSTAPPAAAEPEESVEAAPPGTEAQPPATLATAPESGLSAAPESSPPPVEVITAPLPAPPPENGISAIRDVTLEPGVPDLAQGRRPVMPPLARMAAAGGSVEVAFSVGAGGATTVQSTSGPELLRPAAEQAVASWRFRRTRADRAYLLAVFTYGDDKATAVVRPQPPATPEAPPR